MKGSIPSGPLKNPNFEENFNFPKAMRRDESNNASKLEVVLNAW